MPESTKKNVEDLAKEVDYQGKRVFVRVDLNVPMKDTEITDNSRIRAALPTIRYLSDQGAKVVLCSHLGRPKGQVQEGLRLAPVAVEMANLLEKEVVMLPDSVGDEVKSMIDGLPEGGIALLENVRFYKGEEKNDEAFAAQLAELADLYVNDAFGTAHRAHASTEGITKHMEHKVSGYLMEKELAFLSGAVDNPTRPLAAIIGGAKVSTKITVLEALIDKCDKILIGGGMTYTFFKAMDKEIGTSLLEEEYIETAKKVMEKATSQGKEFILPIDTIVAKEFKEDAEATTVSADNIPSDSMGLDIGPETIELFSDHLKACKTVVWNGPMGVFEFERFAEGTNAIAQCLADITKDGAITIVGGGDSASAVEKAGLNEQLTHISTGGGASLELLEGKVLPGVAALNDR